MVLRRTVFLSLFIVSFLGAAQGIQTAHAQSSECEALFGVPPLFVSTNPHIPDNRFPSPPGRPILRWAGKKALALVGKKQKPYYATLAYWPETKIHVFQMNDQVVIRDDGDQSRKLLYQKMTVDRPPEVFERLGVLALHGKFEKWVKNANNKGIAEWPFIGFTQDTVISYDGWVFIDRNGNYAHIVQDFANLKELESRLIEIPQSQNDAQGTGSRLYALPQARMFSADPLVKLFRGDILENGITFLRVQNGNILATQSAALNTAQQISSLSRGSVEKQFTRAGIWGIVAGLPFLAVSGLNHYLLHSAELSDLANMCTGLGCASSGLGAVLVASVLIAKRITDSDLRHLSNKADAVVGWDRYDPKSGQPYWNYILELVGDRLVLFEPAFRAENEKDVPADLATGGITVYDANSLKSISSRSGKFHDLRIIDSRHMNLIYFDDKGHPLREEPIELETSTP